MSESEVIVVGAGPAGLALSLALAKSGVPSLVLDNGDGEVTVRAARSCVLRPDTASWLAALTAPDSAVPGARWTRWSTRRRQQLVQDVELTEETAPLHLEQHALERGLRDALAREKLAQIVTRSHVDIVEQDATGVTAHTRPRGSAVPVPAAGDGDGGGGYGSDGPDRLPEVSGGRGNRPGRGGTWWRGSYLVGCDGARSTVRKLLGVPFAGRTAVERHAVAALRTELPWEQQAVLHRELGGGGGAGRGGGGRGSGGRQTEVTARPLPDGVWRLDWLLPPRGELVTPDALLERVHATLGQWYGVGGAGRDGGAGGGRGGGSGGGAEDVGPYELLDTGVHTSHQRLARRWRVGRTFLAGDAAHLVGALGVQSVDEGLRDAANLAWKLALAWHEANGVRGPRVDRDAVEVLLDSYESERRGAVGARLRAVDQALPLVRREGGGLRSMLPGGGARTPLELLTDGHLGRGLLGAPATYRHSPLTPARSAVETVPVGTLPGGPVEDVPVIALDGERGRLRAQLCGSGSELLVLLVAPGTAVWDSRHWLSAGLMPELAAAVDALPLKARLLVTEQYPGAAAHTVLVIRPDGHLVVALPGPRTGQLRACADAVRGGTLSGNRPATSRGARR
ncbi:monooxygenase [Streptomyces abyssalis]|uniref:Monooxygenase n=1 Tax=Streptomyces abyssalis TaxID=933944 RepID=A0A1E7JHN2_9ACTN|nr:FAD-dependent monooxygenase [Streptomyces abyssalis]OEU85978.1 monooxygenase [Streptomyces abyssalis]OEU92553.1 monooxygenase [Streptomyces abyssalis]OEV28908.1 monooxygenase [Streptomyces nanshensis]